LKKRKKFNIILYIEEGVQKDMSKIILVINIFLCAILVAQETGIRTKEQSECNQTAIEEEKRATTSLKVSEIGVCTGIVDRQPVNENTIFSSDVGRIYCWTKINGAMEPTEIKHIWYYGNEKLREIKLDLKYVTTRTWSYKNISPSQVGDWKIEVVDINGNVLKTIVFKIESPKQEGNEQTEKKPE